MERPLSDNKNRRRDIARILRTIFCAALAFVGVLQRQARAADAKGSVAGSVRSENGGAISGAQVELHTEKNPVVQTLVTASDGTFFPKNSLPAHTPSPLALTASSPRNKPSSFPAAK